MQPKSVCLFLFYSFYSTRHSSIHVYAKIDSSIQELVDVLQPNSTFGAEKDTFWLSRQMNLELEFSSDVQFIIQGYKEDPADIIALFGLRGCNPDITEESAVMHVAENQSERFVCNVAINQFVASTASESDVHCPKCANGGICEPTRNICLCPPGFVGTTCEHGCGRNLYGLDCSGLCSATWSGCRGMELCNPYVGCLCAPGYYGPQCMDDCPVGNYGSNCLQKCGQCRNEDSCDAYSGLCPDGCLKEYYPPYCREYYAYLLEPPKISDVKYTEATVSFSTEWNKVGGQGRPEFYRVEYYDVNMALTTESPMLLQGRHVTHYLTGLNPGQFYRLRVVLIDFDGNSFTNSSVIPFANFTTPCLVPEKPIYQLQAVSVDKSKFTLSWKFQLAHSSLMHSLHFTVSGALSPG
ncbi:uncharacterized protein [Anabrus simplex]|uniref:uncharacterized protein n=1 Tax=Anabrus simplex TaxID=316456 RepID=UPI0035A39528